MSEITVQLPETMLAKLQDRAERQQIQLDDLIRDAIDSYLSQGEEPTRAELLESLRQSMSDALAGRIYPADELIEELRRKYPTHDDND